jgi:hypothetical protein
MTAALAHLKGPELEGKSAATRVGPVPMVADVVLVV